MVTAPDGRKLKLTGDVAPTDAELDEIFANLPAKEVSTSDKIIGGLETAGTMASSIVAEPLAGLAGIAQGLNPFSEKGAAAEAVESTRQALTYQPRTEQGVESLKSVGEFVEPIGEAFKSAEDYLGDAVFKATDSPTLAAAAATIPTLATEILGIATAKGLSRLNKAQKVAREEGQIAHSIEEAAPSAQQLKNISSGLYKEIDDTGAVLDRRAYQNLANRIERVALQDFNINKRIDPKAYATLQDVMKLAGNDVPLSEVDNLRKVANRALLSGDEDKAIAMAMIDTIDDFVDTLTPRQMVAGADIAPQIGKKLKIARDLYGRAKRSELVTDAVEKARNTASGFENGIRIELRKILNNKKQSKYFSKSDKDALEKVIQGTKGANIAKTIGKLGWSEGQATNMLGATVATGLGGAVGSSAGGLVGGGVGAFVVPAIGQVSKQVAQRLTRGNAEFADSVIRAGKDAKKIVAAYNKHTPKKQRSPDELAELLMRPDIDLNQLYGIPSAMKAVDIAKKNRSLVDKMKLSKEAVTSKETQMGLGGASAAMGLQELEQ